MNYSTNDDENRRYRRFRKLLLTKKKRHSCFISGSCLELPVGYVLTNPTDVDKMYWAKYITASQSDAVNHDRRIPDPTFVIDTKDCHIGFARLRKVVSSSADRYCSYYRKPSTPTLRAGTGPSWPKHVTTGASTTVTRRFLGCFNPIFNDVDSFKVDYVYAIYCPQWPLDAVEWINRERKNGWPSKSVIDKIVGFGCHLVAKPHQSNPHDETLWRFSFSHAEVILIQSWTDVQKYVYHVLRLIKSEVVNLCGAEDTSVLCTYFFKILMLWSCEEKPPEFWADENLETSVGELMCTMVEWLIDRRCPNYFIPGNNMIDHLANDVDLSNEISALLCYKETMLSKLLTSATRSYMEIPVTFRVPNKVMEYGLLAINNSFIHDDLHVTLGSLHSILSTSMNFVAELRYLFDAIQTQLRLTKATDGMPEFGPDEISSIVKNFDSAKIANDERFLVVTVYLGSSLHDILDDVASFAETEYGSRSLNTRSSATKYRYANENTDLSKYKDASCTTTHSDSSHSKNLSNLLETDKYISCSLRENNGDNRQKENDINVAEESLIGCAISSLLQGLAQNWTSTAHLVSSAYCANFYYTALQDYSSATRQCKLAFKYLKDMENDLLNVHGTLFSNALPVVLTNEWSTLFDRNLQLLLGFSTLSEDVAAKFQVRRKKSAVIYLCPLQFLKYIHFQSVKALNGNESVHLECDFRDVVTSLFNGQWDLKDVSSILLLTAIRISGVKPTKIGHATYSVQWP